MVKTIAAMGAMAVLHLKCIPNAEYEILAPRLFRVPPTRTHRRLAGDNDAGLVIHSHQSPPPFDWLHFPHTGTMLCISDMKPVGLLPPTMGLRWSHSVAGSPQHAHRTSSGLIPRTRKASSTSLSEGSTTGMMPLTNELVTVEVLPAIDTDLSILNAFEVARSLIGFLRKEGPQHCYGPKKHVMIR